MASEKCVLFTGFLGIWDTGKKIWENLHANSAKDDSSSLQQIPDLGSEFFFLFFFCAAICLGELVLWAQEEKKWIYSAKTLYESSEIAHFAKKMCRDVLKKWGKLEKKSWTFLPVAILFMTLHVENGYTWAVKTLGTIIKCLKFRLSHFLNLKSFYVSVDFAKIIIALKCYSLEITKLLATEIGVKKWRQKLSVFMVLTTTDEEKNSARGFLLKQHHNFFFTLVSYKTDFLQEERKGVVGQRKKWRKREQRTQFFHWRRRRRRIYLSADEKCLWVLLPWYVREEKRNGVGVR